MKIRDRYKLTLLSKILLTLFAMIAFASAVFMLVDDNMIGVCILAGVITVITLVKIGYEFRNDKEYQKALWTVIIIIAIICYLIICVTDFMYVNNVIMGGCIVIDCACWWDLYNG